MVLRPLLWMLSLFFPARFLKIPGTVHVKVKRKDDADVVKYLPPSLLTKENGAVRNLQSSKKQNQSLVVFSHGLTGTGEENSIFCTSLAKKGYVVASVHHRGGSSCRVPLPNGTCKYYERLPRGEDYDPRDRLEQLHVRAKEFLYCCSWLMGEEIDGKYNRAQAEVMVQLMVMSSVILFWIKYDRTSMSKILLLLDSAVGRRQLHSQQHGNLPNSNVQYCLILGCTSIIARRA